MKPLNEMGKFKTVVIDPPWPITPRPRYAENSRSNKPTDLQYQTMSLQEIKSIPIADCLDDDALVFCWTVNRFIPDTYGLVSAWGLRYSFTMVWSKNDGPQSPNTPRYTGEFVVVARKGSPKYKETANFNTVFYSKRGEHSEKPEEFYDLLRRVTPSPRIDIFNRRPIPGFVGWGNEAPPPCELPAEYQAILI